MDLQQPTPVRSGTRARPHASFAVHDEGEGLQGLYLSPCRVEDIVDALEDLDVHVVYGAGRIRMPTALAAALSGSVDLTSAPCSRSILAAPHQAVSLHEGAFAASMCGEDHGVVFARDPRILRAVLRRWLAAHLDSVGIGFGLDGVREEAIRRLATPVPASSRHEPRLFRRASGSELCTLEFREVSFDGVEQLGDVDADAATLDPIRWIGAARYGWRTEWSW